MRVDKLDEIVRHLGEKWKRTAIILHGPFDIAIHFTGHKHYDRIVISNGWGKNFTTSIGNTLGISDTSFELYVSKEETSDSIVTKLKPMIHMAMWLLDKENEFDANQERSRHSVVNRISEALGVPHKNDHPLIWRGHVNIEPRIHPYYSYNDKTDVNITPTNPRVSVGLQNITLDVAEEIAKCLAKHMANRDVGGE